MRVEISSPPSFRSWQISNPDRHDGDGKVVQIELNEEVRNPDTLTLKMHCREIMIADQLILVQTQWPDPEQAKRGVLPMFFIEVPDEHEELAEAALESLGWIGEIAEDESEPEPEEQEASALPVIPEPEPESEEEESTEQEEEEEAGSEEEAEEEGGEIGETPIEVLGLPDRVEKALRSAKVETIEKLRTIPPSDLVQIKGIGQKTAFDIVQELDDFSG